MAKHQRRPARRKGRPNRNGKGRNLAAEYERARKLAANDKREHARRLYRALREKVSEAPLRALIENDLAAIQAAEGDTEAAIKGFKAALAIDEQCLPARLNLRLLEVDISVESGESRVESQKEGRELRVEGREPEIRDQKSRVRGQQAAVSQLSTPQPSTRVAILSFLFNWPSTGGGIVHTVELAEFLRRAGYDVKHFYARHVPWGVGKVEGVPPFPSEAIEFDDSSWNMPVIQDRFRRAVDLFRPDYVIVTDSWNSKPVLAEAVSKYPYFLRLQALECLCPLNNVRLLPDGPGKFRQCHLHQLAMPDECCRCLWQRGRHSGSLHQAERELCGVGTREYHESLIRAFAGAEAVLVVNPLTEAMVSPYAKCVKVVTAGMDAKRFPWPWEDESREPSVEKREPERKLKVLFAGLVEEPMKGFEVLHRACELLWQRRQDFELVATADPPGPMDAFTRFIGWQSQEDLPRHLRAADIFVFPTIAQEALGRTAVEAMAVGRPVVASRIGGLPFTVADGATGLLCEPGDPDDLARKIETLLDDPVLRERMGLAGRRRFEEHYTWDVIIERHYRPLLKPRVRVG